MRLAVAAATFAICLITWAADPDLFVGTWKVNAEQTKLKSGIAPGSGIQTIKATSDGYRINVGAEDLILHLDGKDYPRTTGNVAKSAGADTASVRRVNSRVVVTTFKRGGKIVATVRREIAADGRAMTATVDGVSPDGKKLSNVVVYDRQ